MYGTKRPGFSCKNTNFDYWNKKYKNQIDIVNSLNKYVSKDDHDQTRRNFKYKNPFNIN